MEVIALGTVLLSKPTAESFCVPAMISILTIIMGLFREHYEKVFASIRLPGHHEYV